MYRVLWILSLPFQFAADCGHFVVCWLITRPWPLLLLGLPALLVGLAVVGIVIYEWTGNDAALIKRYYQVANQALDDKDAAAAEIFVRKLTYLDRSGTNTTYLVARLADIKGDQKTAAARMRELAPADASGHPAAHFWTAMHMLRKQTSVDRAELDVLVHHLKQSLGSADHRQDAHVLLAQLLSGRGEYEQAVAHLKAVVHARPEVGLPLSLLYEKLGDSQRAHRQRQRAAVFLRKRVQADAKDVKARVQWAHAEALGKDFEKAIDILRAGLPAKDDGPLRQALAMMYVAWYDHENTGSRTALKKRIELLQTALRYHPADIGALSRMGKLITDSSEESQSVQATLKRMLAEGTLPATVHFILGSGAAANEDWEQARLHLEQAGELLPQAPGLLNNLAWVLAFAEPPQVERALHLVNSAVELWPGHPELRETRGFVLVELERWKEALVDLEKALQAFPNRTRIHTKLARVYAELGDEELAELHRKRAESAPESEKPKPSVESRASEDVGAD